MADIIRSFGQHICRNALQKPVYTRKLLLAGYRAFGLRLAFAPDRQLPPSRQFSALVDALRASRAAVALKAVVTETNAKWNSLELYRALQEEHDTMRELLAAKGKKRK